jgi:hypothetical protein
MADTPKNQENPPRNLTQQQQEWVDRETDLLVKLRQAQEDVRRAEDQVAQAQAGLDDSRQRLNSLQAQLQAMNNEPGAVRQMNTQPNQSGQPEQSGQPGQAAANQGQNATNAGGLPPNETYVGDAVDTELATTPDRARYDVLQNESQEINQEHAVARDMVQAEDQGVVSVPPENPDKNP